MRLLNVINLRLKLMYGSLSVRVLSVVLILIIAMLINGLYSGAKDSTKLKIGVHFEKESELTDAIFASLLESEIVIPILMDKKEGIKAVKESRIQGFFIFNKGMESSFVKGDYEEVVDLYLLEDNFLPYILTDMVGAEMIGEIAILKAIELLDEAFDEYGVVIEDRDAYLEALYISGRSDLTNEKDNLYVEKTFVMPDDSKDLSYVALENVLLFKQVILGVVYIFISFFMMFLVVNMVRDEEVGLRPKWLTTPMKQSEMIIGEFVSIYIGSLPIILAVSFIQFYYEQHIGFFLITNLLYGFCYSGLLMFLGKILRKVTVYVVVTSAVILILGIVSGSFFLLNTDIGWMSVLTYFIPAHHLLGEVVRVKLIEASMPSFGYNMYMITYGSITVGLATVVDVIKKRWIKYV